MPYSYLKSSLSTQSGWAGGQSEALFIGKIFFPAYIQGHPAWGYGVTTTHFGLTFTYWTDQFVETSLAIFLLHYLIIMDFPGSRGQ